MHTEEWYVKFVLKHTDWPNLKLWILTLNGVSILANHHILIPTFLQFLWFPRKWFHTFSFTFHYLLPLHHSQLMNLHPTSRNKRVPTPGPSLSQSIYTALPTVIKELPVLQLNSIPPHAPKIQYVLAYERNVTAS